MSKQAEFAVILKMNPMFADLGADELQRIAGLCHTQQMASGEVLFQKGDAGDALFGVFGFVRCDHLQLAPDKTAFAVDVFVIPSMEDSGKIEELIRTNIEIMDEHTGV